MVTWTAARVCKVKVGRADRLRRVNAWKTLDDRGSSPEF